MHFTNTILALAVASTASAHATMFGVSVNGVDQGDGRNVYIRSPPNNSPVKNLTSPDLACNANGGKAVGSFVSAAAGDRITFEWFHETRGDDIIDPTHQGPIITYIAPFTTGNGAEPIWSKIAQDGFSDGAWAVDRLRANGGKNDVVLPADLAAGKYLVRQEIIAHHESETAFNVNPARGAQFYPSCVQFEVSGSGTVVPSENFDFNTGYTYADPGIVFDIHSKFTSYRIPGPSVLGGGSGSAPGPAPAPTASLPAGPTPPASGGPASTVLGSTPTTLQTSVRRPSMTRTIIPQPSGSWDASRPGRPGRR